MAKGQIFRPVVVLVLAWVLFLSSIATVRAEGLPSLVITEVQTQSASSKTEEFIEIYNPTGSDINLSQLEVAYKTASGATLTNLALTPSVKSSSIRSHGFMMFSQASYSIGSDATFTTGISDTGGHIQVSLAGVVLDAVGWGNAVAPETQAAPIATKGASISRKVGPNANFQDTNNNAADFIESVPSPQGGGLFEVVIDVCPNVTGLQSTVPSGLVIDTLGNCVPPAVDMCTNMVGDQLVVPEGYERTSLGDCHKIEQCLLEVSEVSSQPNFNNQEYVEVVNNSSATMQLGLCKLKINSGSERQLGEGAILPGNRYIAVFSSGTIKNSAGEVTLINSAGQLYSYAYPEVVTGQTINFSSGNQFGLVSDVPTPGAENNQLIFSEESPGSGSGVSEDLVPCPEGKYRNPETNRCKSFEVVSAVLSPCDAGQERNPETNRCRKIVAASSTLTPCKEGQERNPETNRCRAITSSSGELKPCDPGQERSAETNRCRKVVASSVGSGLNTDNSTKKVNPLKFSFKIVLLILAVVAAYGIYEYRIDIRNYLEKLRASTIRGRPPD